MQPFLAPPPPSRTPFRPFYPRTPPFFDPNSSVFALRHLPFYPKTPLFLPPWHIFGSVWHASWHSLPKRGRQPRSGQTRGGDEANARRTHLDRGAETPLFAPFYIFVKALLPDPPQPSLGSLRTAFTPNANREDLDRGSEGWKRRLTKKGELWAKSGAFGTLFVQGGFGFGKKVRWRVERREKLCYIIMGK